MSSLDDDLVPLGDVLAEREWADAVTLARADIERAMGRRQDAQGPIDFMDAEALLSTDFGPTPWLVDGICTEQAVMVIGGEPKTAKTWAALEMAIAVATDTPAFGEFKVRNPDKRGAWMFLCEDNPRSVQRRVRSIVQGRGPVLAGWGKRLHVKALGSMHIDDVGSLARYVATVRQSPIKPALVAFDPLRDLHAHNEDSSTEMQGVYSALRALRTVLQCSVVFVHHAGKATADGEKRRGGQKLRGSSALHGAVDAGLYLTSPARARDEDKRKTTMTANVEGEVKAAASVGDFALALEVFDDANREAVRAQWVISKDGELNAKKDEARQRNEARVMTIVQVHHAKNGAPVSLKQIKADLGIGARSHGALTECIAAMVAAGKLTAAPGYGGHPAYSPNTAPAPAQPPPDDDFGPTDYDPPDDSDPWLA
jgi:hypothetical protein